MGWAAADQVVPIEQAEAFFTDRIRANPKDAFSHLMRATALAGQIEARQLVGKLDGELAGMASKAIADFTDAIRLDPKDAAAYDGRGNLRDRREEYDQAIADFAAAMRIDPQNEVAYRIGMASALFRSWP